MDITINARNIELTPRLREYVEKKVSRLDRYLPNIVEARMELHTEHRRQGGDRQIAQLTVRNSRGAILRAEDKNQTDIFAAVDSVMDKMYRQIRRYKGKRRRRGGAKLAEIEPELLEAEPVPLPEPEEEEEEPKQEIVRRKRVPLVPIDEQEAMDRIEELDHDFYLFLNADTARVCVLYRREDGNYGLLEAVEEGEEM